MCRISGSIEWGPHYSVMYLFIEMILFFDHLLMRGLAERPLITFMCEEQNSAANKQESLPMCFCQASSWFTWAAKNENLCHKKVEWKPISVNCKQISFAIMIRMGEEMVQNDCTYAQINRRLVPTALWTKFPSLVAAYVFLITHQNWTSGMNARN